MTSSTVTKPTMLPSFSTTGTARRLYLAIFWATTSWSSRAFTVITRLRMTSDTGWWSSAITRSRRERNPRSLPVPGSIT